MFFFFTYVEIWLFFWYFLLLVCYVEHSDLAVTGTVD